MTRATAFASVAVFALSACSDSGRLLQPSAEPRLGAARALGSKIAFTSDWDAPGVSTEIYVVNADGTGERQVTSTAGNSNGPAWSPNGRMIAFQSNRAGNDDIWVMDANGGNLVQLTDNAVRDAKPSWSPDGKRIAFHRDVEYLGEVHGELFTMNADGSDVRMLSVPSFEGFHGFPSWSQGQDAVP